MIKFVLRGVKYKLFVQDNFRQNKYINRDSHILSSSWQGQIMMPIADSVYNVPKIRSDTCPDSPCPWWNGNIFRITGHLCGELTGHRWIPRTKASDAEFLFSLICAWMNGWVSTRESGDLRRHRRHYDVKVMHCNINRCPFYEHGLTLLLALINDYIHCKIWNEFYFPFSVQPLKFGNG